MSNYLANTVMKEYSNSPVLLYLLSCADQWIDITQFSAQFLANVWDISTAVNFGLDIWGRILGVSRYLQVAPPTAGAYFGWDIAPTDVNNLRTGTGNGTSTSFTILGIGNTPVTPNSGAMFYVNGTATAGTVSGTTVTFATAPANGAVITWTGSYTQTGTNWKAWNQAPFYGGPVSGAISYALPDQYYRQLLLVKAAANIAASDCPSINALMRAMFGTRGRCFVGYDIGNPMHIAYHFQFYPTPVEIAIIQSGLFPQPAGTTVSYVYANLGYVPFGFTPANRAGDPLFVKPWSVPSSPFYSPTNALPLL